MIVEYRALVWQSALLQCTDEGDIIKMTTVTMDVPEHLVSVLYEVGDQLPLIIEMGVSRFAPVSTQAYMEAVELLAQSPTPEAIANFRFSPEIESRIEILLERQDDVVLSKAEEIELQRLSHLEGQLQLIKAHALLQLHDKG